MNKLPLHVQNMYKKGGLTTMDKDKNISTPDKLSFESDGEMGNDKQKDENEVKRMIPNDLFFNSTQDSE